MYFWFQNVFTDLLWASATTGIPTLMFNPVVIRRTFIQRACNAVPRTGKHMNTYDQLEYELAHAYFRYTENKHEKTSYEFRVGSLLVYYLTIIQIALV